MFGCAAGFLIFAKVINFTSQFSGNSEASDIWFRGGISKTYGSFSGGGGGGAASWFLNQ